MFKKSPYFSIYPVNPYVKICLNLILALMMFSCADTRVGQKAGPTPAKPQASHDLTDLLAGGGPDNDSGTSSGGTADDVAELDTKLRMAYVDSFSKLHLLNSYGNPLPGFTPIPQVVSFAATGSRIVYATGGNSGTHVRPVQFINFRGEMQFYSPPYPPTSVLGTAQNLVALDTPRGISLHDGTGNLLGFIRTPHSYRMTGFQMSNDLVAVEFSGRDNRLVYLSDRTGRLLRTAEMGDLELPPVLSSQYAVTRDGHTTFRFYSEGAARNLEVALDPRRAIGRWKISDAFLGYLDGSRSFRVPVDNVNSLHLLRADGSPLPGFLPIPNVFHFELSNRRIAYLQGRVLHLLSENGQPVPFLESGRVPIPEVMSYKFSGGLLGVSTLTGRFNVLDDNGNSLPHFPVMENFFNPDDYELFGDDLAD